jgi:hypothetical protein
LQAGYGTDELLGGVTPEALTVSVSGAELPGALSGGGLVTLIATALPAWRAARNPRAGAHCEGSGGPLTRDEHLTSRAWLNCSDQQPFSSTMLTFSREHKGCWCEELICSTR